MKVKDFRAVMKDRRKLLGLTQEQVGEESDISKTEYYHIERGAHKPRIDTFIRICKVLGLNIFDFVEEEE